MLLYVSATCNLVAHMEWQCFVDKVLSEICNRVTCGMRKFATNLEADHLSENVHISCQSLLFCASSFLEFHFSAITFVSLWMCIFMSIDFKSPIFIRDPCLCSFQEIRCDFSFIRTSNCTSVFVWIIIKNIVRTVEWWFVGRECIIHG